MNCHKMQHVFNTLYREFQMESVGLELQILRDTYFKGSVQGQPRPLHAKKCLGKLGHQGQVKGH